MGPGRGLTLAAGLRTVPAPDPRRVRAGAPREPRPGAVPEAGTAPKRRQSPAGRAIDGRGAAARVGASRRQPPAPGLRERPGLRVAFHGQRPTLHDWVSDGGD